MLPPVAATSLSASSLQQAADVDAVHDDEQADEEEDGDPFDVAEGLVDVVRGLLGVVRPVVEQHQDGGAEHGDGGGLQMQRPRQHEGDHHDASSTTSDCLSSSQSSIVSAGVHRHHRALRRSCEALQVLAPEQMDDDAPAPPSRR